MPRYLGLDTSTLIGGIAIVDETGRVIAEGRHDGTTRNADLLVAIDDVCKRATVTPSELAGICIGAGPGSFTGLRIGMATAKGIAFAAECPLWSVSSLAALADEQIAGCVLDQVPMDFSGWVAVLDARRGEVFAGCFALARDVGANLDAHELDDSSLRALGPGVSAERGRTQIVRIGDERVLAPTELSSWVRTLVGERSVDFVGDALAAFPTELASLADRWHAATPSGAWVARLALEGARVDVLTSGGPRYIRPSEAEVKYPDGVPGARKRP